MTFRRLLLAALICLAGPIAGARAQSFYYQPYAAYQPAPSPPSWSYDPYTSCQAPCPQGIHGDLQTCQQKMPPTYGQPSYWPQR
jgi:hypothetical protein